MNIYSINTIIRKEMYVFFKHFYDEISMAILFPILMIWTMDMGLSEVEISGNIAYSKFIAPGIVIMIVVSTGLFNTGFVMMFEKEWSGSFEGLITCPVSTKEIATAKILSGAIKGLINGFLVMFVLFLFMDFDISYALLISPIFLLFAGLIFSAIGLMLGVTFKRGFQLGTVGNLIVFPLTFFGGMFFDIKELPVKYQEIVNLSPVTMMISGFRKLMIYGEVNVFRELVICCSVFIVIYFFTLWYFEKKVIN